MKCMQCQATWRVGAGNCVTCGAPPLGAAVAADEGARLFAAKHYEEALGAFERAGQLAPDDPDLARCAGHCLFHLTQYNRAEDAYALLGPEPVAEVAYNLGQIAIYTNRLKRAREFFETLRQTQPIFEPGQFYLGLVFDSAEIFQAECCYYLAIVCWNTHELEAAEYYFRQTLALAPRHLRACRYLGNLHFQQKQYSDAADLFHRCIELFDAQGAPEKARIEVYNQLGMTCEAMGSLEEATELFKRILDFRPGHPGAVYSLNRIYEKQGLYAAQGEALTASHADADAEEEGASTIFGLATYEEMQSTDVTPGAALAERMVVGRSEAMQKVLRMARLASASDSTVLLQGENGTGKELIARVIVAHSNRTDQPFLALNCAAVSPTLIESELFGHMKGAFTGAVARKEGYFEAAHNGTILLDEIGELDLNMQVKLLRVLQEREFLPVGGEKTVRVNVRIIAATNRDLHAMVRAGTFREDLYYRLNVLPIRLPPLRHRPEDIPILAAHFIRKYSKGHVRPETLLSEEDIKGLSEYEWPGNVRELENIVERGIVLGTRYHLLLEEQIRQQRRKRRDKGVAGTDGAELEIGEKDGKDARDIKDWKDAKDAGEPPRSRDGFSPAASVPATTSSTSSIQSTLSTQPAQSTIPDSPDWTPISLEELERRHIERTLDFTAGNRSQAARLLGINPATLWRKMKTYEIAEEKVQ